jgi:hypothetical protein
MESDDDKKTSESDSMATLGDSLDAFVQSYALADLGDGFAERLPFAESVTIRVKERTDEIERRYPDIKALRRAFRGAMVRGAQKRGIALVVEFSDEPPPPPPKQPKT